MARTKLEAFAERLVESTLEEIDERLQELNQKMAVFDRVKEERDKLLAARRALVGGGMTGGTGGGRVRQQDIVDWMQRQEEDEFTVNEVAKALGVTPEVARGHFNRGKGERFEQGSEGKWKLRDPEEDE